MLRTRCPPAAVPERVSDRLVVHEWGTFTVMQDEKGRPLAGINNDDEPVPQFVHRQHIVQPFGDMPATYYKGIAGSHPDVVVRLETPVIYFYPPRDRPKLTLDVEVRLRGGWLTEYYPKAEVGGIDRDSSFREFPSLPATAVGSLRWQGLVVGGQEDGPKTDSRVWLSPRQVKAASVKNTDGESERYLFYRGVGNLPVPLSVSRQANDPGLLELRAALPVHTITLVDARRDGTLAFRGLANLPADAGAMLPATFKTSDYAADNLPRLREHLFNGLVREGLFDEEAQAMMNTWEAAYFRQPGTRVFFMVPDAWTNEKLPLSVRGEGAEKVSVERAMIGRIELLTDSHRERLALIGRTPPVPATWINDLWKTAEAQGEGSTLRQTMAAVTTGAKSFLETDLKIPPEYRAYLELGRFRNTLVLHELKHRPTDSLKAFAAQYGIRYAETKPPPEQSSR